MGAQWKHKSRLAAGSQKGALFSRLSKDIIIAAKNGDPDPNSNPRLRLAVEAAKKQSMPRENIERSIKKGAGLLDEVVNYETVTYEGFGPHRVPVIVECLTDNKNRTASNIRVLFRKDGQLGTAVLWLFDRVGVVEATHPSGADAEEAAIEAGAQDVESDEDGTRFTTDVADLGAVTAALTAAGWVVTGSELRYQGKDPVELDDAARGDVDAFLQAIDDDDDVHRIYAAVA